jgi:hypothetical protein
MALTWPTDPPLTVPLIVAPEDGAGAGACAFGSFGLGPAGEGLSLPPHAVARTMAPTMSEHLRSLAASMVDMSPKGQ